MTTIECLYSCDRCGLVKQRVQVPERVAEQSTREWMEEVFTPALAVDHRSRSPLCGARSLSSVYIPMEEGALRLGEKARS